MQSWKPGRTCWSRLACRNGICGRAIPITANCRKPRACCAKAQKWEEAAIDTTFQSVFGPEEWLAIPVEHVAELAKAKGKKRIAVIAPAFSADCIETLEEISGEIRPSCMRGARSCRPLLLNDEAAHIEALVAVIEENLGGWLP